MFFKKKIDKNNKKRPLFIVGFLVFLFLFSCFFFKVEPIYAQSDPTITPAILKLQAQIAQFTAEDREFNKEMVDKAEKQLAELKNKAKWDKRMKSLLSSGSRALQNTVRSALNKIAYDTATWVGSGAKGQKPLFITEGWNTYLTNIGDQAAGQFIEQLGRNNGFKEFNLCEPDFAVKMKIGFGLKQQMRPSAPTCTLSEMYKNWDEEIRSLTFLKDFQKVFDPTQSDLGIALTLQTGMMENIEDEEKLKQSEIASKQGWIESTNIAGRILTVPGSAARQLDAGLGAMYDQLLRVTQDPLVDAANVFLNQLAITAFNKALSDMAKRAGPASSSYNWSGLADYNASPGSGANDSLRQLLEPKFNTRGDYDIIASLSSCDKQGVYDPTTGCVIEEKFAAAIREKKTVGQAINEGSLNANWAFGFKISKNTAGEPGYNEGYPYRSMLILRKYRIIPAGWEEAAKVLEAKIKINSNSARDATLGKMVACFDETDNYTDFYESWCKGLVDPNWVLKAPQNYCAKEGYGPEIISDDISGSGVMTRQISRNDNYCGDEQSCIDENEDGSCNAYGYCTTEKRTWNFGADKCEPKYNTCQTFKGSNGQTFSYLENTLNYEGCVSGSAGCKKYAWSPSVSDYDVDTGTINWSGDKSIYFDGDAKECSEENEGCHEFIRTKSGLGTNLIINSGFEDDVVGTSASITSTSGNSIKLKNWSLYNNNSNLQAKIVDVAPAESGKFLHITESGKGGLYVYDSSSAVDSAMAEGFVMEPGVAYTLSARVYLVSGEIEIGIGNNLTEFKTANLTKTDSWENIKLIVNNDNNLSANELYIYGINSAEFYIDNFQLEIGRDATNYKNYGTANKVYEKLAPAYLNCGESNPSDKCDKFVQSCESTDVGCELYTSTSDGIGIPAKTAVSDECPLQCNGFNSYIQLATSFEESAPQYFIPGTARSCSADAVGCDEFTNLDEVANGGENKEYYSYLRECIKPDASCAEFYTWEGSDENGYQLKVFSLKSNGAGPAITPVDESTDDSLLCSEEIYNLPITDSGHNPDCRQFYNRAGGISYHLYTRTISCSDNCHSYRRTEDASDRMAIPGEGKRCSAAQAGCREYGGNAGSNIKDIFGSNGYNFEDGLDGWSGTRSNEAVNVSEHSLETSGKSTQKTVGTLVRKGGSYILNFWAKKVGAGETEFSSISFNNVTETEGFIVSFSNEKVGSEWKLYKFNLGSLRHDVDSSEILKITANEDFYIDNIKLTEVVDRYYLIKNSWSTPDECNQDVNGNPSALYMLGCSQYKDRDNKTVYLHNFSQLCQETAVGCELMIDTHNSSNAGTSDSTTNPMVNTDADNFIYVVYDKDKQCNSADKGCERFGSPYTYGEDVVYGDVYLKNNPDDYEKILCGSSAAGCTAWNNDTVIFKYPGDTVCEWRKGTETNNYDWYKKYVNKCGKGDGAKICLDNNDCAESAVKTCELDKTDIVCDKDENSAPKTIGYGGGGGRVYQPKNSTEYANPTKTGWAGVCPEAQSGCTEYIDPISKFSVDLADGKNANLEANTLYILSGGTGAEIDCPNKTLNELGSDNKFIGATDVIDGNSTFFNFSDSQTCVVTETGVVKKAIVEYRLNEGVSQGSCTNVDFEQGCILLNERTAGKSLAGLIYDANLTVEDGNGVQAKDGTKATPITENNANQIIKVEPDRVCGQWLACRSYVKNADGKPVCFDVGLCDSLDASGNCDDFIAGSDNVDYASASGYYASSTLSISKMSQEGDAADLSNGGFELAGKNGYPVGWSDESDGVCSLTTSKCVKGREKNGTNCDNNSGCFGDSWTENKFKVLSDAVAIEKELYSFSPEGNNILKVGPKAKVASEGLNLNENTTYVLTAYVDTRTMSLIASSYVKIYLSATSAGNFKVIPIGTNGYYTMNITNPSPDDKIIIETSGDGGYAYFDDIKIRPALKTGTNEDGANEYVKQSCRLYPKQDSLSCLYTDNTGIQKGLSGYCLQYDRLPGDPNACLLWYPVDKVKGEGIEENAGYKGKYPLYYCTGIKEEGAKVRATLSGDDYISLFIDSTKIASISSSGKKSAGITAGYLAPGKHVVVITGANKGGAARLEAEVEAVGYSYMDKLITSVEDKYGWYCASFPWSIYQPVFLDLGSKTESIFKDIDYNYGADTFDWQKPTYVKDSDVVTGAQAIWLGDQNIKNKVLCRTVIDIKPVCSQLVQVVSASGSNKVYQSRLSGAENISVDVNRMSILDTYLKTANYDSDLTPYGTINYPEPAANPYEWDSSEEDGIQPLPYSTEKDKIRMGQLYYSSDNSVLKTLFAQSYAGYELSYGSCSKGGKCTKEQECPGSACSASGSSSYYACNATSENSDQECSQGGCSQGKCLYNEDGKYRCEDTGDLCCVPKKTDDTGNSLCQSGKCVTTSLNPYGSCSVGLCATGDGSCQGTGQYKCVDAGNECCAGGACRKICSDNSNNAGADCTINTNCPITKCSNSGLYCDISLANPDTQCQTYKCDVGELAGAACNPYATGSCRAANHDCIESKCDGGERDGDICSVPSECPPVSGSCVAGTGGTCQLTSGTCLPKQCVGGSNSGADCAMDSEGSGGNKDGCANSTDVCKQIFQCSVSNDKCCPFSSSGACELVSADAQVCIGGPKKGQPCVESECIDGVCENAGRYVLDSTYASWGWNPSDMTTGTAPIIRNIFVNTTTITKNGFVSLKFNSQVNKNQLPLVEYDVDWGDGTITTLSGAEMRDRPNANDPHEVFHLYSYWDLVNNTEKVKYGITCPTDSGYCTITPSVKIKDNWGWCNGPTKDSNVGGSLTCDKWVDFDGVITVKER